MKEIIVKMESNGQLFPVRELIRCKDCGKRYANGCRFYMSMIATEDDFFCGDAEPKGGEQK